MIEFMDNPFEEVTFNDVHMLHSWLDEYLNANGQQPWASGYDKNGVPIMVWLDEEGGDSVIMRAVKLWSEASEVSNPTELSPSEDLEFPIVVFEPGEAK